MEVPRSHHKQAYPLPEKGIHDENGFLFYHGLPRVLLEGHRKRLAQHGIVLEGKKYTDDEVQTLINNWEAYRKEYGFSYWSILKLLGKGAGPTERQSKNGLREQTRDFLQETNFWPRFCAGVNQRTSDHIKSKVNDIFDLHRDTHVSVAERPYCEKLYMSHRSLVVVADTMQRSLKSVLACVTYMRRHKRFSFSERRWLWTSIKNAYPEHFKDSEFPNADVIDWKDIESKILRNAAVLEQNWIKMTGELQSKIDSGHTLDDALDLVAPKCQHVSPLQVAHFLEIVRNKMPDKESRRIDPIEKIIAPLMVEQGLTGFSSRRYTEFEYLRLMANKILWKIRRLILFPCGLRFSLSSLLKVLIEVLRALPNSDTPRQITITTKHFLETLIRLQRQHDSTWRPRNKRLRKVISELLPDLI